MPGKALDSVTQNKGEKYYLDPYHQNVRALGKYFQNGAGSNRTEFAGKNYNDQTHT